MNHTPTHHQPAPTQHLISPYSFPGLMSGLKTLTDEDKRDLIIESVLKAYSTDFATIDNICRKRHLKEPRQMIMHFMCLHTKFTLKAIGRIFQGRFDHSTVLHNKAFISDLIKTDDETRNKYNEVCLKLQIKQFVK